MSVKYLILYVGGQLKLLFLYTCLSTSSIYPSSSMPVHLSTSKDMNVAVAVVVVRRMIAALCWSDSIGLHPKSVSKWAK